MVLNFTQIEFFYNPYDFPYIYINKKECSKIRQILNYIDNLSFLVCGF